MHSPILYVILSMVPSTTYLLLCTYLVVVLSMYLLLTYVERERATYSSFTGCAAKPWNVLLKLWRVMYYSNPKIWFGLYSIKFLFYAIFLKKQKKCKPRTKGNLGKDINLPKKPIFGWFWVSTHNRSVTIVEKGI